MNERVNERLRQRYNLEKDTLLKYSPSREAGRPRESEIRRNRELDTHVNIRMAVCEESMVAFITLAYPQLLEAS